MVFVYIGFELYVECWMAISNDQCHCRRTLCIVLAVFKKLILFCMCYCLYWHLKEISLSNFIDIFAWTLTLWFWLSTANMRKSILGKAASARWVSEISFLVQICFHLWVLFWFHWSMRIRSLTFRNQFEG